MLRLNRPKINGLLAVIVAFSTVLAMPSFAGEKQGSLELHRWKHVMDEGGRLWIAVQFTNVGNSPVTIKGIAPSAFGPWSDVSQTAEPGQRVRAKVKMDGPSTSNKSTDVWIYSTEGLAKFTLTDPS